MIYSYLTKKDDGNENKIKDTAVPDDITEEETEQMRLSDRLCHTDHRMRLKSRFLKEGIDGFAVQNSLELLLFYALPQMDTNPLANRLLEHFCGSFSDLCDAPLEELKNIHGVSENTAILLKMIPEYARLYCADKFRSVHFGSELSKLSIGSSFVTYFMGLTEEQLMMMYFDSYMKLLACETLFVGSFRSALIPTKKLAERVILLNASHIIAAHNHPFGLPLPSREDIASNDALRNFLASLGVTLLDHIVVSKNMFTNIGNTTSETFDKLSDKDVIVYEKDNPKGFTLSGIDLTGNTADREK